MKIPLKPALLPWITLLLGCIGAGLRVWQLLTGIDDGGLLITGHPAMTWILVLTGVTLVALLLTTGPLTGAPKHSFNFPASTSAAVFTAVAGMGIGVTSIMELALTSDRYMILTSVLGLLCVPVMLLLAQCRRSGKQPHFLLHALLSIYLMLRLICQYRLWSPDPQLADYCWQLLALVCLMLAVYQRAVFDIDEGKRRSYIIFHLAAVYFCCLALPGSEHPFFFLASGLWMMTDLCSLRPMPPARKGRFG